MKFLLTTAWWAKNLLKIITLVFVLGGAYVSYRLAMQSLQQTVEVLKDDLKTVLRVVEEFDDKLDKNETTNTLQNYRLDQLEEGSD